MPGEPIGREAELAEVEAFLDRAEHASSCLLLEGEPGIGKTTVWLEAIRHAESRGVAVLSCRPAEAEAKLSFATLADLLEPIPTRIVGSLPEPQRRALQVALLQADAGGEPIDPRAVAAGFRNTVIRLAEQTPVILAIDDLQWVDLPSARALTFMLRRIRGERVALIATRRTTIPHTRGLAIPKAQTIRVESLSLAAIHDLLEARLGRTLPRPILVRLYEAARGNPFYALEVAREVLDARIGPADPLPVPKDLQRLVRRRIGRLSSAAKEALLAAAALSEPTRDLLTAALETEPTEALEEAESAEIVEVDGDSIRFTHPLYAAAVYRVAPRSLRTSVHRRLADVAVEVEERATHLALATNGPSAEAALELEQAAGDVRQRGAALAAGRLLVEAVRLTPANDLAARHRRELGAAQAYFDGGDGESAREILAPLLEEMPPGPDRVRPLLLLGMILSYADEDEAAAEACRRAIEDAPPDASLLAEAHLHFALVCYDALEARRSVAAARALVENDPGAADDLVAAVLLDDAYEGLFLGEGLALEQVERALALVPRQGRTWLARRAQAVAFLWAKYTDDLVRARELLGEEIALRREEGADSEAAVSLRHLAEVECWLGNWRRSAELAAEAEGDRVVSMYTRALVAACRGEVAEARSTGEAGLGLAGDNPWFRALHLSVLGFLELSLQNVADAAAHLDAAAADVARIGMTEPARFRFDGDRIEALVALGRLADAEALVQELEHRAEITPRPWNRVMYARGQALALAASGDADGALVAIDRALREHESLPMPFEQARTLLVAGQLRRRAGMRRAAKHALESALAEFERLGAPLWSERAVAELRRIPIRRAASEELTPTEERVAELAAAGRTNREVAQTLFMSPKTVEANLTRIYRKLGIHSRAELGATMATRVREAEPPKP